VGLTAQLVPAVTELIVAELLYLQYTSQSKPIFLYINSTGCTRADGTTVGFETEATAIYDTMSYSNVEVQTVGVGVAIGQACMLLSAGAKGKRFMLPHATAMLQQPRVPSTGQRQAVEIYIKWQEVLRMKKTYLDILSRTTGHSLDKLDRVSSNLTSLRPTHHLSSQPREATTHAA
jgi:ATP-dependent Clp endopeptidase proteolytic subunit ClpP